MPVYLLCNKCKRWNKPTNKKCGKCDSSFPAQDKSYYVVVNVNKKRVTRLVPNNLSRAREIENQVKNELLHGEYFDRRKANIILDEAWEKYLAAYKAHGKAWKAEERRYNQYLKPKFGKKAMTDITPFDIESLAVTLSKTETKYGTPYTPKTIKNIIDLLSILFNYSRKMELYDGNNPCERVKRPKINNEVMNVLSLEDLKKFLKFLDAYEFKPIANLIKFLIYTGVRIGEAFKLTFDDINFENKAMILRDPKNGKDQHLYLNESTIKILINQKKYMHPDSNLVFPNQDGRIRTEIGGRWHSIKIQAGIPLNMRCHDLRHQYATLLASSGKVDAYTVQKLMTHRDFSTTQRYAHLFPQTMRDGVKIIDDMLKYDEDEEKTTEEPDIDIRIT